MWCHTTEPAVWHGDARRLAPVVNVVSACDVADNGHLSAPADRQRDRDALAFAAKQAGFDLSRHGSHCE